MPDDRNVAVSGAGQTHPARVKFASDTVREKVGDLLAEAGGTPAAVNEDECQRVAKRLRKARGAAPLNLTGGSFAFSCPARSRLPKLAAAYRRNMNSPPCASSLSSRMAPARGPSGTTATSRMRPICPSRMIRSELGRPSASSVTR